MSTFRGPAKKVGRGRTSAPRLLTVVVAAGLFALLANCGLGGECLRFSDCGNGLTCSNGQCLPPSGSTDADVDSAADATSDAPEDARQAAALDGASRDAHATDGSATLKDASGAAREGGATGCITCDDGSTTEASTDAGLGSSDASSD